MITLNQIVQRLTTLALNHKQVNHFYFGDPVEWLSNGEVNYPACFVDLTGARIDRANRQTVYGFDIWFCDLTNVDADARGNETEVLSDLTSIAEDYAAMLNRYADQHELEINDSYPMQYYREKFTDWVGAVKMSVELAAVNAIDRCVIPANAYTFERELPDMIKPVLNYTYIANGEEGNSLTIPTLEKKEILLVVLGNNVLTGNDDLGVNNYTFQPNTGVITFGTDLQFEQALQILYRSK